MKKKYNNINIKKCSQRYVDHISHFLAKNKSANVLSNTLTFADI